ncbi:3-oxoacyl-[acyl-carrier protein] reductase [Alkalibacillus flavidus]|uniref:3-oxoacyl-[acyl-carrier protein] reductase n=1 Tax=Alkalibacillus flavidus TaxID=546021 RepID=A0ABV2KRH9_9BACI
MKTETVLVVGASSDIGGAIVHSLANDNPNRQFVLHYHQNHEALNNLIDLLDEERVLMTVQADLATDKGINDLIQSIPFDIETIIFAQGQAYSGLLLDTPDDVMDQLYYVHVKSTAMITRHFLPSMTRQQSGQIVVVSSIWGEEGVSYEVWYSMMKSAQNHFVKSLAKEVGPSQIRVNGVTAGFIETKMNNHLNDTERQELLADIPLHRAGHPEDIASAVKFLCSTESSYINGHLMQLNGGMA